MLFLPLLSLTPVFAPSMCLWLCVLYVVVFVLVKAHLGWPGASSSKTCSLLVCEVRCSPAAAVISHMLYLANNRSLFPQLGLLVSSLPAYWVSSTWSFCLFCVAFKCLIMESAYRIGTGGWMRAAMLLFSFFFLLAFDLTELDLCSISKNIIIWSLLHAVTHSISGPCVWLRIKTWMYQDTCPTGCKSEPVHTFRIRSFSSRRQIWVHLIY